MIQEPDIGGRSSTAWAPLDIALVLRRTLACFGLDFAGVVMSGFALVTLPGIIARSLETDTYMTAVITLRGVLAVIYVALVSWGVVSRLSGRALPPHVFLTEGLARARPGVETSLVAAAAVVAALIVQLFAQHGTAEGWLLDVLLLTAGLWAASVVLPVVAVAVVERLGPLAAMKRAAMLTVGHRNRTMALVLLLGLTLAPVAALIAGLGGGSNAMLAASLFDLFACSLIATMPAVVYASLPDRN